MTDRKSLVDIMMTAGVCKSYYEDGIDSFILVSSDSDYWGLICSLPKAKFLVMYEYAKCGSAIKNALSEHGIYYCSIDDFCSGNVEEFKRAVLFDILEKYLPDIVYLNGKELVHTKGPAQTAEGPAYKEVLRKATLKDLLDAAQNADEQDLSYIKKGVEMNLKAAEMGQALQKVGFYIKELVRKGLLQMDLISSTKILTACAADARMDGRAVPVMSSGESGNQGVVTILVPWKVGKEMGVDETTILKSIALSHLLNGYVKVFTGELAPICGCAIAAGVGATAAIVYQQRGACVPAITLAINNIISDIGGMLCDGAKSGCALKVVSSTDSAIRSAYMAIHDYGITEVEGFVGRTAEETIQNLGNISNQGMSQVDPLIVDIMQEKSCR